MFFFDINHLLTKEDVSVDYIDPAYSPAVSNHINKLVQRFDVCIYIKTQSKTENRMALSSLENICGQAAAEAGGRSEDFVGL